MKQLLIIFAVISLYLLSGCSRSQSSDSSQKKSHNSSQKKSNNSHKKPDHIVIVIEENKGFDQIIGNPDAAYINSLAEQGLLFTDMHGVWHPSQPNYLALFSGSRQGVTNDRCLEKDTPFKTDNLGHELLSNGYTFAGYSETMPKMGFTGCGYGKSKYPHGSPLYARKHNPWVDWQGDCPTCLPDSVNKTFKAFPSDYTKLPTVAFVVPNEDNEMHNGPASLSIPRADHWLKVHMSDYITWAKSHNSLFILTYDEDNFQKANLIPMIFVGQMVQKGQYDKKANHYNVLRTIEELYGLPHAGPADEKAMTGIWTWESKAK
jgi:acid phosphatase